MTALLAFQQAASAIMGITRHDIAALVESGDLKIILLPGKKRPKVKLDDVIAAIENRKVELCPSTVRRNRHIGTMTSNTKVYDFTAQREKQLAAKQKR